MGTMNLRWRPRSGESGADEKMADDRNAEAAPPAGAWERLPVVRMEPRTLARNRVVTASRVDPAHVAFDLLRTRLLHALQRNNWSRVAITSPTKGCGKTFVAANLALSLSRRSNVRSILIDLDLRIPAIGRVLGIENAGDVAAMLRGMTAPEQVLKRVAPNLAVAPTRAPAADSAELLQEPGARAALENLRTTFSPDVTLFDLPPTLPCDDVLAFLPQVDGILLVAAAGVTTPAEIQECERLFAGQAPLLGVILNKAEDPAVEPYYG